MKQLHWPPPRNWSDVVITLRHKVAEHALPLELATKIYRIIFDAVLMARNNSSQE